MHPSRCPSADQTGDGAGGSRHDAPFLRLSASKFKAVAPPARDAYNGEKTGPVGRRPPEGPSFPGRGAMEGGGVPAFVVIAVALAWMWLFPELRRVRTLEG